MIEVKRSVMLWDHVPELQELRDAAAPEDSTIETFEDNINIDIYLRYTGLRIYTNGRDFKKDEPNIKTEMKYLCVDGEISYPDYEIPDKEHFILI